VGLNPLNIIALLCVPLVSFHQGRRVDGADYQALGHHGDTLAAARVYGVKTLPVLRATEEVRISEVDAPSSVAQAVRRFTGVQVKDYGGAGGLKTVNVRSLGSEHVGIFLNGIQIDNAQNMQVDLGRFSTEGLSTVSLYSGQKSRRLQSAKEYASGAALYLNSARPLEDALRLRIRGGSFGTVNPAATWEKLLGSSLALRVSGDFLGSNGRYPYDYFGETLTRENGDIRSLRLEAQLFGDIAGAGNAGVQSLQKSIAARGFVNGRGPRSGRDSDVSRVLFGGCCTEAWNPGAGQWYLHLYSYGSERGFPGPVIRRSPEYPFSAERQADQDLFAQGSWTQDWSERYSTALRFKYSNNYTHYNTHAELNPMAMPYDLHYRQQSAYASLSQSLAIAGPWELDLSTDIQHNTLESDSYQAVRPQRTTFTGVLATRLAWEAFRSEAHIVYMGAWDRYSPAAGNPWAKENAFRSAWMPGLSAGWYPTESISITAFAKRSFRLPSFNDLYYTQVGNANLRPEQALQIGVDARIGRSWSLRISPYYNRVSNKIVAIPTASQFRWTMLNIGLADIAGLDLKADGSLNLGEWRLGGTLRYTYQLALDHSEGQNYGNQIPYIPRHSGSIDINTGWRGWSLAWNTVLTGGRWSRSANTPDYYIEPWTTSDASLSWTTGQILTLSLSVNNIFNRRYQIVQGYPMPGTSVMLSAALTL